MGDLEEAKKGNPEAFERLINNVKAKLYKTGMAILKNDDDVCDAIQDTLLSSYKNLNSLKEEKYFNTWIIRIMINKCYDIIRKNKRELEINQKVERDSEVAYYDRYSEESNLENIISKLVPELKLVTVLYYYDELSIKEIATIVNIPEGTVKTRLLRAREKLYKLLKEEEGD